MWGRTHYPHPGASLGTGNRCGHRPADPAWHKFSAPETRKPLPFFIKNLISRVREYYASPRRLPTLSNLNGKVNEDGQPRLNRSEAREAECLVLEAILSQTEYATLRVGTPLPDGRFIHRDFTELAEIAGLINPKTGRPSNRFWRAIRRLKLGGAIDVHKQFVTLDDGAIRARPGIKTINMHFIVALGRVSYDETKKFRTWCSKRLSGAAAAHRAQHPGEHDPDIANRKLREQQRARGATTNAPQSGQNSPALPDRDVRKELQRQHSRAQLEFVMNLRGQYPGRQESWYIEQTKAHIGSLDDWIARQHN
ncbi:plasmid replication protein repA (plasmid) [Aeromonas media]|uniref:Plasmid replication protein repA n=7 Tax=Aeromonas TaxID=642 RepID=A0A7D5YRX7_AERCA|nr:plasmid replication protein repA [Aeromonas caviae]QYK83470.1 plasmid replication protein repA [Aeromonas media]